MGERGAALLAQVSRFRTVLLVAAVGLALMLWPSDRTQTGQPEAAGADGEETRLERLLTSMEGVGRAEVLLSDSGAAVTCQGADSVTVRLAVTEAVRCYTGLGADRIVIFKMNESWRETS